MLIKVNKKDKFQASSLDLLAIGKPILAEHLSMAASINLVPSAIFLS